MIDGRGGGRGPYSVDEASTLLGIPRPTLYRYLREYSVPHEKRAGRIRIPESSVERLRQVRDLHREGMGTGAVRRLLKEGVGREEDAEIKGRLERISREIEGVRSEGKAHHSYEELTSSQAMRTLLARQSLLMGAVLDLLDMVEELMRANGHPVRRTRLSDSVSEGAATLGEPAEETRTTAREVPATAGRGAPVTYLTPRGGVTLPGASARGDRTFGAEARPVARSGTSRRLDAPPAGARERSAAREPGTPSVRLAARRRDPGRELSPGGSRGRYYGHLARRRRAVGRAVAVLLALLAVVALVVALAPGGPL